MTDKRKELLEKLLDVFNELESTVLEVRESKVTEPGVSGDWSIKDILAHVTAWEERVVAWAEALNQGGRPSPAPWSKNMSEEQVNSWIYEKNKSRPFSEVLEEWRKTHLQVIGLIREMEEDLLFIKKIDWLGDRPFADAIPGNSYEHQQDHTRQIQAWLSKKADLSDS